MPGAACLRPSLPDAHAGGARPAPPRLRCTRKSHWISERVWVNEGSSRPATVSKSILHQLPTGGNHFTGHNLRKKGEVCRSGPTVGAGAQNQTTHRAPASRNIRTRSKATTRHHRSKHRKFAKQTRIRFPSASSGHAALLVSCGRGKTQRAHTHFHRCHSVCLVGLDRVSVTTNHNHPTCHAERADKRGTTR